MNVVYYTSKNMFNFTVCILGAICTFNTTLNQQTKSVLRLELRTRH